MTRCTTTALLLTLCIVLPAPAADLKEELWTAAKRGDAQAVEALLEKGADPNAKTSYGVTALLYAADKGHLEVVRVLLRHKAEVNLKDQFYHSTPLSWAAEKGHAEVVKALLQAGAEGADDALLNAAAAGHTDVVRAILDTATLKPEALTRALKGTPAQQREVIDLLVKAGAKAPATVQVTPETLKSYAGVYRNEEGVDYEVAFASGRLRATSDARTYYTLTPLSEATFQTPQDDTLTFVFQRQGDRVSGLVVKKDQSEQTFTRHEVRPPSAALDKESEETAVRPPLNWPSFRGPQASGVADGQRPVVTWDVPQGVNVRWRTPIPGLGHSCPVIWGDRLFVTTAVSSDSEAEFRPGLYGDVTPAGDTGEYAWKVYCLERRSGKVLWEQTAHRGKPRTKRHPKASQANCTPATDGQHLIVCFGSEGLYSYDLEGRLLWQQDLGTLDAGWFFDRDYQWGFASSPILYRDLVIVQCDIGKGSFVAAYRVSDGKQVWNTPRDEIPSWGTPTVVEGPERAELVTNASHFARGYDPLTGKELWRLGRQSEITVPTPVAGQGLIFITNGYRPNQPIYAVRPGANGDITLPSGQTTSDAVAWSTQKGGPYLPTPIVYGEHLYTCSNSGLVACYEAKTGKQLYRERLGGSGGYSASPVAADGKLYFTSEEEGVSVVRAGPHFELLAVNPLGETCLATPALSDGLLFFRTQHHVLAIGRPEETKGGK